MEHISHTFNILPDQQSSFRKRRLCESQLVLTLRHFAAALENGEQIDARLLDFSEALDEAFRKLLTVKF